jgi:tetratricopeptide (TPR) repeat protein
MLMRLFGLVILSISAPAFAEWHEASSDHFLIVADQNERDVRDFSERLERYHAALMQSFNKPNVKPSPSNRVTIYVVKSGSDVRKLAGDKSGFLQGFYQPRAGGSVAFISRVDSGGKELDDSERILFHEYAHHVMFSNTEWITPRWMSEGFAEFYSTVRFERDGGVSVGLPALHRGYELAVARDVPIEALLDRETYQTTKSKAYDEFYGKSWALYHYLLVSNKRPGQLVAYLVALANGSSELDAARNVFGDLKILEKELNAYLRQSRWSYFPINGSKLTIGSIATRKMRPGEAAIMPIVLESKRGVNAETAKTVLAKALPIVAQNPAEPAVLAALAEAEHDAGNYDAAIAAADKALAIDPKLVNAHVQKIYALGQLAEQSDDPEAAWKRARRAVTALNKVEPDHPIPLIYYYRSLLGSGQEVTDLSVQGLERALQLAPYDQGVRWTLAQQYKDEEDWAAAYRLLLPLANDPHNRSDENPAIALLAELKAKLDIARAAATARSEKGAAVPSSAP